MNFTLQTVREIWGDETIETGWEVGPDRDGLGCVEIRYREGGTKILQQMTFPPEAAKLIGQALIACAEEMERE